MTNIIDLPNDILHEYITKYLYFNNLRILNTTNKLLVGNFTNNYVCSTLIKNSNKIKLYYKLIKHKNILFNNIYNSFNVPFGEPIQLNNNCLMYSPINQYGKCRFCNEHLNTHKYTKMTHIYLSVTSNIVPFNLF